MNYYEKVRDAVERIAECTTSDAQGIIEAWELRLSNPRLTIAEANRLTPMDKAEEWGISPTTYANAILGRSTHGLVRLVVNHKPVGDRVIEHVRHLAKSNGFMVWISRTNGYSHDWTELVTLEQWEKHNAHSVGSLTCNLVPANTKVGTTFVSFS
jgi:hypothetical protein